METQEKVKKQDFQFPVGMSNRSYVDTAIINPEILTSALFQFPVGMSNRSYVLLGMS